MGNKKISQLDPIGTIDVVQDSIPIVDYSEGVTKRTNLVNIGQRVLEASSTTNLAEGIHEFTRRSKQLCWLVQTHLSLLTMHFKPSPSHHKAMFKA
jgi:hypothetical protein